jgi:tetratricopeptide (TPR) repeat protein
MQNNRKVVWQKYAESLMSGGKIDEALTVLRRAAKAIPDEDFETRQAFLFMTRAQKLIKSEKWDEALKLYDSGLAKVDEKAAEKIKDARIGMFLNRSVAAMQKGEYEAALEILKQGMKLEPTDGRIENNMKAAYDKWANGYMKKKDWAGAIAVYEKGLVQFPGDSHLENNLAYCKQEEARK